jgi:hypothetical protein
LTEHFATIKENVEKLIPNLKLSLSFKNFSLFFFSFLPLLLLLLYVYKLPLSLSSLLGHAISPIPEKPFPTHKEDEEEKEEEGAVIQ